jgi:hypothetical protein
MNTPGTSTVNRIAKLLRLGCAILIPLSATPACYAYKYIGTGVVVTSSDLNGSPGGGIGGSAYASNSIIMDIVTDKTPPTGCLTQGVRSPSPGISYEALTANNYTEAKRKIGEALGMTLPWHASRPYCNNMEDFGKPEQIRICITSDRDQAGSSAYMHVCFWVDGTTTEPDPTECHASTRDVSMGVLTPGEEWVRRQTTLFVTCNQEASLSISVNDGRDIDEADTRAHINFEYDKSHACHTCDVPVWVNMVRAPYEAGSYSWGVPVVVDYN